MKTVAIIGTTALLTFASQAAAATKTHFELYGPHLAGNGMRVWARQDAMPLPQVKIWVGYGNPVEYSDNTIYLPKVGQGGWTALAVRGLFYHEIGHVFDRTNMTPPLRAEFRQLAGVPAGWHWWKPIRTVRWVTAPDYYIKIAPGEMFGEEYAACALGLTQRGYQDAGYNTYGWVPPQGTDEAALCAVIRAAA